MGCFKVLSKPISPMAPLHYKGLYRSEPFPQLTKDKRITSLWERYTQYLEPLTNMGVTAELTVDELKLLANLLTQETGEDYEVIFFDDAFNCSYQSNYYGIDIVGLGGYSILGEGGFNEKNKENGACCIFAIINKYFKIRLNEYGLFTTLKDASCFCGVLKELQAFTPDLVEREDWRITHIFKVVE